MYAANYASFLAGMQFSIFPRPILAMAALCLCLQGQTPTPPAAGKEAPVEAKGLPPRLTPGDYQFHTQAGNVTIAAEFTGHSLSTGQGVLNSEEYVVVELGMYGPAGTRLTLSNDDFSLRINGKKSPLPSRPYGMVFHSLKDPDYEPPTPPAAKSKTSLGGGGQGGDNTPPPPPPIPIPVQRAMAQRVQKAALPEGDRALPQAGLLFFQYRGKVQNIESVELIYNGPAGKATLNLQP